MIFGKNSMKFCPFILAWDIVKLRLKCFIKEIM